MAVGITGASGAAYATRTLASLLSRGYHVELVITEFGRRLILDELGEQPNPDQFMSFLTERYGSEVSRGELTVWSNKDLGAGMARGSQRGDGRVIGPCSMKTLAESLTDSLVVLWNGPRMSCSRKSDRL